MLLKVFKEILSIAQGLGTAFLNLCKIFRKPLESATASLEVFAEAFQKHVKSIDPHINIYTTVAKTMDKACQEPMTASK